MKRLNRLQKLTLTLLTISAISASCLKSGHHGPCVNGTGTVTNVPLSLDSIIGIEVTGATQVTIIQGSPQEVYVTGSQNVIANLDTNVVNGIWHIKTDSCYDNYDLEVTLVISNLNHIGVRGTADVIVEDFVNQQDINVDIRGNGTVIFNDFDADGLANFNIRGTGLVDLLGSFDTVSQVKLDIRGTGDFIVQDSTTMVSDLDIDIKGKGNYEGFMLKTQNAEVNISGSGQVEVHATDNLDVQMTGSGDVFYKGYPLINVNTKGASSLHDAN